MISHFCGQPVCRVYTVPQPRRSPISVVSRLVESTQSLSFYSFEHYTTNRWSYWVVSYINFIILYFDNSFIIIMWHVLSKPMALQTGHILTVELIYLFCYTNTFLIKKLNKKNGISCLAQWGWWGRKVSMRKVCVNPLIALGSFFRKNDFQKKFK